MGVPAQSRSVPHPASTARPVNGKLLGTFPYAGAMSRANPIDIGSGNKREAVVDYHTWGEPAELHTVLQQHDGGEHFCRRAGVAMAVELRPYLKVQPRCVVAERADGQQLTFTRAGTSWDGVMGIRVILPGSKKSKSVVANITYEPFGPINGLTYGNGVQEMRTFDLDYRKRAASHG
jgi:hypothetical protein